MSKLSNVTWRDVFKHYLASARVSVLGQLLRDDIRCSIDSNSTILMSNVDTAAELLQWYTDSHEDGHPIPAIAIAQELTETTNLKPLNTINPSPARMRSLEQLGDNEFTHVFLHNHTDRNQDDLLKLFQQVHKLLAPNGKLVVSRRKRDGLADILHAAGVQVPGRQRGRNTGSPRVEDDGLMSIATQAGFSRERITHLETAYMVNGEQLQQLLDDLKIALTSSLGSCNHDGGWRAEFDEATEKEVKEYGGILLIANVIAATR